MSLHALAQHMQAAGRGEDKQLVHMTPKEVAGLQALAMAHGGSLTINPHTGLPEAGFLSSILPMVVGAALTATGVGAPMAALMVGGGAALATGSLQKGLMAGLGAYGGAGLMEGLTATGAAAAGASGGAGLTPSMAGTLGQGGVEAAKEGLWATPTMGTATNTATNLASTSASPFAGVADKFATNLSNAGSGISALGTTGGWSNLYSALPTGTLPAAAAGILGAMQPKPLQLKEQDSLIRPYEYTRTQNPAAYDQGAPMWSTNPGSSRERNYFTDSYTALTPYKAPGPEYAADGGVVGMADGGSTTTRNYSYDPQTMQYTHLGSTTTAPTSFWDGVRMFLGKVAGTQDLTQPKITGGIAAPVGGTAQPTQAAQNYTPNISIPAYQTPEQRLGLEGFYENMNRQLDAYGGYAAGGNVGNEYHLGDYSDGGRLLKGPGDGVSDSIPAVIGDKQPARLADGEFVVPARIVSELGNGSTDAGARKLYSMMDRVQKARRKTVGKDAVAKDTRAEKLLPA